MFFSKSKSNDIRRTLETQFPGFLKFSIVRIATNQRLLNPTCSKRYIFDVLFIQKH